MSGDMLFVAMLLGAVLFCALLGYVFKVWSRDADAAGKQKRALGLAEEELARARSSLEAEKDERSQIEERLTALQYKLDAVTQERLTDRTAYQGLFDKLETQLQEKGAELKEKDEKIQRFQAGIEIHHEEVKKAEPDNPPTIAPPKNTPNERQS